MSLGNIRWNYRERKRFQWCSFLWLMTDRTALQWFLCLWWQPGTLLCAAYISEGFLPQLHPICHHFAWFFEAILQTSVGVAFTLTLSDESEGRELHRGSGNSSLSSQDSTPPNETASAGRYIIQFAPSLSVRENWHSYLYITEQTKQNNTHDRGKSHLSVV